MEKLYYVTGNKNKFNEMKEIADSEDIRLEHYPMTIKELQTDQVEELVREKAFEAFQELRRPLIVEQTVLKIDAFNQLPGPHTGYIYSKLGNESIVEFCKYKNKFDAVAESYLCYCDGKGYVIGAGSVKGRIAEEIDDSKEAFDWDRIFKPSEKNKEDSTYAAHSERKYLCSMRRKAWDHLKQQLKDEDLKQYKISVSGHSSDVADSWQNMTELAKLIREKKVMLFIGAGISKSVGMPLWDELLKSLEDEYDEKLFKIYGDNLVRAEYIRIWHKDKYVSEEIQKHFSITDNIRQELTGSKIYKSILELDCPVIYTTNYDQLIETYYETQRGGDSFDQVVTIKDMEKLSPEKTRIMKFHGDVSEPDSIVLAESEYFGRMDFQNFMDVQLQADMLRYHVLFLGYGLSDINVKMLLYLAGKRQKSQGRNASQPERKNYIFTVTPNQIQKIVFEDNNIVTLSGENADKKAGTEEFLLQLSKMVRES